jgi:alpha-galactosidase
MEDAMQDFPFNSFKFVINNDLSWNLTHNESGITTSSTPLQLFYSTNDDSNLQISPTLASISVGKNNPLISNNLNADSLSCSSQIDGILLEAEFAFPLNSPLFLFRFKCRNNRAETIRFNNINMVGSENKPNIQFPSSNPKYACFVNGWQSWSYSGTYSAEQKQKYPGLSFIQGAQWCNATTPAPKIKGVFYSDFFTVVIDQSTQKGVLAGFLSQKQQFGHAEVDLRSEPILHLKAAGDGVNVLPGKSFTTDWAVIQIVDFKDADPVKGFIDAAALENNVQNKPKIPVGWCSWYHYYTRITPENLISNIKQLNKIKDKVPLDLIQIDDGFEKGIGDWLEFKLEFSGGFDSIVREIKTDGFTPGLWLAPFIVSPASDLYKKHPEMLLRNHDGKFVNSGWNWNRFTTSLDMSHPAAQEYVRKVIDTAVHVWGFQYLKLDFLYTATIPGRHYNTTITRAQIYDQAMQLIREAAGEDTYILGCGAPIGGMIGHVDAMRIGADVSSDWKPKYKGVELLFPNEPNIPAVENAMQNTITRAWFHNRWWMNDPDCLLLRSSTHLTEDEIRTQASLTALSGGLILLSDDLAQIPPERLKIIQSLIPIIGKTPMVLDWHQKLTPSKLRVDLAGAAGTWHLISYTNWEDHPVQPVLYLEDYNITNNFSCVVSSFWDSKTSYSENGNLGIGILPPHATWLAAVRNLISGRPMFAGSNLHISQGLEVSEWKESNNQILLKFLLPHKCSGEIFLRIPANEIEVKDSNGKSILLPGKDHLFVIPVQFDREEKITINY